MALYATFTEVIDSYLGVTPTTFFTILSLMVGAYLLVSSLFVSPDELASEKRNSSPIPEPATARAEPAQLGDVTVEELKAFDGSDPKKPLLMAIKGNVYDVSRGRMFYGPGGPYALFAGRDASRALALMSFDPIDLTGNLEGLSSSELEVLQDWEYKFLEKYVKVGKLVSEKTTGMDVNQSNEESSEGVQASERDADEACNNTETKEMELDGGGSKQNNWNWMEEEAKPGSTILV